MLDIFLLYDNVVVFISLDLKWENEKYLSCRIWIFVCFSVCDVFFYLFVRWKMEYGV